MYARVQTVIVGDYVDDVEMVMHCHCHVNVILLFLAALMNGTVTFSLSDSR